MKDIESLKRSFENDLKWYSGVNNLVFIAKAEVFEYVLDKLNELDEPETLSMEWIDENKEFYRRAGRGEVEHIEYIRVDKLQKLLVPKQEEVDRAYKDGYEKGKQHTFYKGYLEGLAEGERKTNEYFESITEEPSYEQVQCVDVPMPDTDL